MEIYIHNIILSGHDDFCEIFNYVSWLWEQACNPLNSLEKQDFYQKEHFDAKFNLETGMPISFLSEYKN